jgi:hypothetical protein
MKWTRVESESRILEKIQNRYGKWAMERVLKDYEVRAPGIVDYIYRVNQ